MDDLKLKLTPEVRLNALQVVPSFDKYNELLQRAVVLLLLSDVRTYWIDNQPLYDVLYKSNCTPTPTLDSVVAGMGRFLKEQLEEDSDTALESVNIGLITEEGSRKVTIDITSEDGEVISGEYII